MKKDRWQQIEQLYHSALEREEGQRRTYLKQACAGDDELRRDVESLLAQEERTDGFLGSVGAKLVANVLAEDPTRSLVGRQLGSYKILSLLGAGGMGEVYQAHDTKLGRNVAIKVLPAAFVHDPEHLARFQREARMLAALNHPNIATIHGLEVAEGMHYLVMELVPGETLAQRLRKGPLPIEQVLQCAIEIADALDKAHRKGITHRDLKPGNVMVTKTGTKLLDFGLAKLARQTDTPANISLSKLPTANDPVTAAGTILGTLHYMAPEQLEGKDADARTDIFAFGVVVYEMATGRRAFEGKSQASAISAIMSSDPPPISSLQHMTPHALDRAVKKCLAKEREDRWQSAKDLTDELKWIADGGFQVSSLTTAPVRGIRMLGRRTLVLSLGALLLGLAIASLASWSLKPRPPQPLQAVELSAEIGVDASLYTAFGSSAIFSPDGTRLAFAASGSDQKRRIYVRSLDQLQASALSSTENARDPFFSPDGQWIGFFADGKLKQISVQGGAAIPLCDAADDRGGSWGDDGTIVFAPNTRVPLAKVSSAGGTPQPLTTLEQQTGEITQRWPQVLPGSKAVLFTSNTHGNYYDDAEIIVYSTASGQRKTVQRGGFYARYVPSGHVVYLHEGTLFAVPFDLKRLEVTGQAVPVLEGVVTSSGAGGAQVSFSKTGNLVYVAGRSGGQNVSIYWMDHEGEFTPLRETPGAYSDPAFSPDGKRLALEILDGKRRDIWVYQWEHDALTRLTFAGEDNRFPVWTPDGQRIVYSSQEKGGTPNLWWIRADGAGDAQRLTESKNPQFANSFRPDGKVLAFSQPNPDTGAGMDIITLPIEGSEQSGWKLLEARGAEALPEQTVSRTRASLLA